ncbi:MAG TPA: DUF2723 domain-containing protein, partial [Puia sp.]|nr:DUF2723 domain-containing protein [Puia sp.]
WDRPICFTNENEAAQLGLGKYLRSNGLAYRLIPVENDKVDNEIAYKNVMEKFSYGNASHPGVYFDEENRHRMNVIKLANVDLAISLAEAGDKEKARRILENYDQHVRESNIPYGMTSSRGNQHDAISTQFLSACYLADDLPLAKKVSASLKKDLKEQLIYYRSLGESDMTDEQLANTAYLLLQGKGNGLADDQVPFASDIVSSFQMLRQVEIWEKSSSDPHISEKQ